MATITRPASPPRIERAQPARRTPAGHAILAVLIALGLGAVLNAEGLAETAERQPFGWRRTVAVTLVRPAQVVAGTLGLDEPREALQTTVTARLWPEQPAGLEGPDRAPAFAQQPAVDPAGEAPAPGAPSRAYSPDDPLRLWIGGDSLVEAWGATLAAAAEDAGAIEATVDFHYSTGLARPDYFDWSRHAVEVLETVDPDVAVMMMGGNDAQDIAVDGQVLRLGSERWQAAYRTRASELMGLLTRDGRALYWVGLPVMQSAEFDERMALLSRLYREAAEQHPRVEFVDIRRLFAGSDGQYAGYLEDADGRLERVRRDDGIHLTPAGGDRLAEVLLERILADWPVPPAPEASPAP